MVESGTPFKIAENKMYEVQVARTTWLRIELSDSANQDCC